MVANSDTDFDQHGPPAEGDGGSAKSKLFLRLFLQNQRRLYAYILTLLPVRDDAEDVFQETSLVLWDKFDEANPPRDFTAWGCRIAYFKVLDFYKKRQRSRVHFSQEVLERIGETAAVRAAALRLDDRTAALESCIEKLNPRDQHLLACRFAPGATTETTAAEIGRSVEAVYKALAKIRHALFECITRTLTEGGHA